MKKSLLFKTVALAVFSLVPVGLFAEDFSDISQTPEEASSWKFSFSPEVVYAMDLSDAYEQTPGRYYWVDDYNSNGWWTGRHEEYEPGKRKKKSLDSVGLNLRMDLKSSKEIGQTGLTPEFFALVGFMASFEDCEDEDSEGNIWLLRGSVGGNLRFSLTETISLFGGPRVGVGILFGGDERDTGLTYGVGGGVDFKIGKRDDVLRIGVDYTEVSVEGEGTLSVSDPKWLMFTVGYSISL